MKDDATGKPTGKRRKRRAATPPPSPAAASAVAPTADLEAVGQLFNRIAAGVIKVSRDERIEYLNSQARRLFTVPDREPLGMFLREFEPFTIAADGSPFKFDDYPPIQCLRSGQTVAGVTVGLKHPGGVQWVTATAEPLVDPQTGETTAALVTVVDSSHPQHVEESLRQSEDRYRRLVDNAPDAIVVHRNGPILYINEAGVKLWGGRTRDEFVGRDILDFVHPRDRDEAVRRVAAAMSGQATPLVEHRHVRLDGRPVYVEVTGTSCVYNGQNCVQVIFRDVTERKRVERVVRRQRELLRKFFDRIPVLVGIVDAEGRVKVVNREWKRVVGWGTECSLRQMLDHMYPDPQDRQRVQAYIAQGHPGWRDYPAVMKDGRVRLLSWANIKLSSGDRIGIAQDVTELRRVEQELRQAKAELEERVELRTEELTRKNLELRRKNRFMERTLAVQEQDRTLVAYEIHDTFLQDVIGALMFVETMYENNGGAENERNIPLAQAQRLLRECINKARRMISGLRPPIIDEQGVQAGVEYLVNEFNGRGMELRLSTRLTSDRYAKPLETTIFRIVQEALSNIERHSGSKRGDVSLVERNHTIRIEVRDFGVGFSPETVGEGHYGLEGIRERARLSDGTAAIESWPGRGTRVVVELPIPPDGD